MIYRTPDDEAEIDFWIQSQPPQSQKEIKQQYVEAIKCADLIKRNGMSPNLDFPD